MASMGAINEKNRSSPLFSSEGEIHERPIYRRLGFLNGLLIGLGLAIGAWGLRAISLTNSPVPLQYPSLIAAAVVLIMLNAFTGWLTTRVANAVLTIVIWLVTAFLSAAMIALQPYQGRTLAVWLADRRFWGLPIYPTAADISFYAIALAGLFVILVLTVLALLESIRLHSIYGHLSENGRLTFTAIFFLLLPLPIVAVAGYITNDIVGDKSAVDIATVHKAIETARTYEGDLFALGLEEGISYSALQGVREQLGEAYTLMIGEVVVTTSSTFVVAHFDNGAWINCRVDNGHLSFCYDASPPYTTGFASLITGEEPPENCRGCLPRGAEEWQGWLQARRDRLGDSPQISRLAQWGGYVIMRAQSESGDYAIECRFNGIIQVSLESCSEATVNE